MKGVLAPRFRIYLVAALDANRNEAKVSLLTLEWSNGGLAGGGVSAIPTTRRGDPQNAAALFELRQHASHCLHVLSGFLALGVGICVDVFLGVDADEVAAHRKGNSKRICRNLVAGYVDDLSGFFGVSRLFEEDRHDLRVGLRLVVGVKDHVLALRSLFHRLLQVVLAQNNRILHVDKVTEKITAPLVKIQSVPDFLGYRIVPPQRVVGNAELELVLAHPKLLPELDGLRDALEGGSGGVLLRWLLRVRGLVGRHILGAKVDDRAKHLRGGALQAGLDGGGGLVESRLVVGVQLERFFSLFLRGGGGRKERNGASYRRGGGTSTACRRRRCASGSERLHVYRGGGTKEGENCQLKLHCLLKCIVP
ncbi:unnamed protein product [Pseudo-nitzschia multistriata]|uniref:Uncharacterized protein n=1 Tax=Pseudo-nitzschia multistriata TaxID=183589 RepID=A0A448ZTD0_9STRA|nr:unnamed protein product [Pseudo-nitzschia multistriata]